MDNESEAASLGEVDAHPEVTACVGLDVLARRGAALAGVAGAGLLLCRSLVDRRLLAASDARVRELEHLGLGLDEGPCIDCYRTGEPVAHDDLARARSAWPRFAPAAVSAGFRAVQSLPLRMDGTAIGSLNLFSTRPGFLADADRRAAQAFVDAAAVAVVEYRARIEAEDLSGHLQRALDSRVVIEQAKGIVAATLGIGIDEAFDRLRRHARGHHLLLPQAAERVVDGSLHPVELDLGQS